jgi:hypothetical protein
VRAKGEESSVARLGPELEYDVAAGGAWTQAAVSRRANWAAKVRGAEQTRPRSPRDIPGLCLLG